MATYKEIQAETKRQFGFVAKTCWIADAKAEMGLISREAANRIDPENRKHPCPPNKRDGLRKILEVLQ
jgi:hypothetical protein